MCKAEVVRDPGKVLKSRSGRDSFFFFAGGGGGVAAKGAARSRRLEVPFERDLRFLSSRCSTLKSLLH